MLDKSDSFIPMGQEILDKFKRDRDSNAYAELMATYRPLVRSVCQRYLRNAHDADDAMQETFLKLVHHADAIDGSIVAWLTRAAYSSSIDIIRRQIGGRRQREQYSQIQPAQMRQIQFEAIRRCVQQALLELDDLSRELVIDRFFKRIPLRLLAAQRNTVPGTVSRWVSAATRRLADILGDMGVEGVDSRAIVEFFNDAQSLQEANTPAGESLRFAPDWQSPEVVAQGLYSNQGALLEGWTRPLRVGAVVSLTSTRLYLPTLRAYSKIHEQVNSVSYLPANGVQMVGIIEPGSESVGQVECTIREYGLLGGLIRGDDREALATLDVIILGMMLDISPTIIDAISDAVRGGVGLLNEYWIFNQFRPHNNEEHLALMLADSPVYTYHHPDGCTHEGPAIVLEDDPLLPGMRAGTRMQIQGCGPAYRVVLGAKVCIAKDVMVPPSKHGFPNVGDLPAPVYIVGSHGRGRVVVSHIYFHNRITPFINVPVQTYFQNLLMWLAEPRRAMT